jgi:hypothetical protein
VPHSSTLVTPAASRRLVLRPTRSLHLNTHTHTQSHHITHNYCVLSPKPLKISQQLTGWHTSKMLNRELAPGPAPRPPPAGPL